MLSVAAEDEAYVPERAVSGLQGWVDCFEKAEFAGSLFCGGINDPAEASGRNEEQHEAYEFGEKLQSRHGAAFVPLRSLQRNDGPAHPGSGSGGGKHEGRIASFH